MNRRRYIEATIAALSTGVLAGCSGGGGDTGGTSGGGGTASSGSTDNTSAGGGTETATTSVSIRFRPQTTNGETVTVQSVSLPHAGYVVIHDVNKSHNDPIGEIIGASAYLKAGTHKNVPVGLSSAPNGNFNPRELHKSQTLSAVPHQESTGDRTFEFNQKSKTKDIPYTDSESGNVIVDTAYVTVRSTSTTNTRTNQTDTTPSTTGNRPGTSERPDRNSRRFADEH